MGKKIVHNFSSCILDFKPLMSKVYIQYIWCKSKNIFIINTEEKNQKPLLPFCTCFIIDRVKFIHITLFQQIFYYLKLILTWSLALFSVMTIFKLKTKWKVVYKWHIKLLRRIHDAYRLFGGWITKVSIALGCHLILHKLLNQQFISIVNSSKAKKFVILLLWKIGSQIKIFLQIFFCMKWY